MLLFFCSIVLLFYQSIHRLLYCSMALLFCCSSALFFIDREAIVSCADSISALLSLSEVSAEAAARRADGRPDRDERELGFRADGLGSRV